MLVELRLRLLGVHRRTRQSLDRRHRRARDRETIITITSSRRNSDDRRPWRNSFLKHRNRSNPSGQGRSPFRPRISFLFKRRTTMLPRCPCLLHSVRFRNRIPSIPTLSPGFSAPPPSFLSQPQQRVLKEITTDVSTSRRSVFNGRSSAASSNELGGHRWRNTDQSQFIGRPFRPSTFGYWCSTSSSLLILWYHSFVRHRRDSSGDGHLCRCSIEWRSNVGEYQLFAFVSSSTEPTQSRSDGMWMYNEWIRSFTRYQSVWLRMSQSNVDRCVRVDKGAPIIGFNVVPTPVTNELVSKPRWKATEFERPVRFAKDDSWSKTSAKGLTWMS